MSDFYSEVSSELQAFPLKAAHNLNLFLLSQKEKAGISIKRFLMKNTLYAATVENPLTRLSENGTLTQEEYAVGMKYCIAYELSSLSHHARPSYDGTPISSVSTQIKEKTISQSQINAARFVYAAKAQLTLSCNYETRHSKGKFRIVTLKLPEILEEIFEKQKAVRSVEKSLGINHSLIEERVKKICGILLTC